ncbi:MAG: elongation factor P [Minisyncoccia bacterium]
MFSYLDLKRGTVFLLDGQPYQVIESKQMKKAQDVAVVQTKIRNLITGKVIERNFHKDDIFEEAELEKIEVKFIYSKRGKFYFSKIQDPSQRIELIEEQIGDNAKFLKPGQIVTGLLFEEKMISINLPIKVQLKVIESPLSLKGERAQSGTKMVTLETGAKINVPLFIKEGDIIEINTEKGEYVRRV